MALPFRLSTKKKIKFVWEMKGRFVWVSSFTILLATIFFLTQFLSLWSCSEFQTVYILFMPEAMNSLTGLLPNLQSFVIDDLPSSLRNRLLALLEGLCGILSQLGNIDICLYYTRRVMEFEQLFVRSKLSIRSLKL